ncbi:cytoplasmic linker associated protein [Seminavis robusta]|uniref:Cytoplasmic linker associated protein n=1 Tax=Seminavis robusta TaxID=568900 RepID=A0A9N8H4D9_9STRA|nr:cytoplasmic linker associated protein [Seminavis robusta]|eukprot:Sro111_g055440.1 cytoplasmic linker associated protein (770) ;mRNA; r:110838-113147
MAYLSTPRNGAGGGSGGFNKGSPRKMQLEEGPIRDLVHTIESTRPEQWQKRTQAFTELVAQIPTGAEYARREAWYNSPPNLRHLHQPIGELLKDPRSTVVKRTCESLLRLFALCQGDAKYLFKDLMPVVLQVHAQTVQVIRNQVQSMVCEIIPICPCKMAMPLWLDRLKTDKSRTVREACVLYLDMGVKHWTMDDGTDQQQPYLSEENWVQIGTAFIKTLRDPSPTVRSYAKSGIGTIRDNQPVLWEEMIRDPDGPAGKDMKLQKWLIKVTEQGNAVDGVQNDELSVASRFSHYSTASKANNKGVPGTPSSRIQPPSTLNRPSSRGRPSTPGGGAVPISISVGGGTNKQPAKPETKPPQTRRGLGPPLRRPFGQVEPQQPTLSPTNLYTNNNNNNSPAYPVPQLGTPPRPPIGRGRHSMGGGPQQRSPSPSPRRPEARHQPPLRSHSYTSGGSLTDLRAPEDNSDARSVASHVPRSSNGAARPRPSPEGMNGHAVAAAERQVINLIDKSGSPQDQQQQDPPPMASTGVYSHASSTDMLQNVTKSIDQTLAHPYVQQQQQQQQQQQPPPYYPQQQQQQPPEEGEIEEGPFIASMNELKQHASRRRSRRSIHMKERWSRGESIGSPMPPHNVASSTPADAVSSLGGSMMYNNNNNHHHMHPDQNHAQPDTSKPLPPTPLLPEHYIIAEQLLRVHKTHVDQIMETLKIEMDTLRDFEQSLEHEQAPSPEQVLDYFESVGLCLDQRTTAGNIMQREMDRISKGAFQPAANGNK